MKQDQASSTAFTVLQGILLTAASRGGAEWVPDEIVAASRRILAASEEGRKRLAQVESPLFRTLAPFMENLMIPGLSRHYVLRKRFIEEATRAALAEGFTQVVSLGAGFDTLTWRFHSGHSDATFIEIDHPATSGIKRQALEERGDNLHLLAVDLAEHDLPQVLGGFAPFDGSRRTLFICEGVLPYLPPAAVEGLFAALKTLTGSGTRFVFTAVSSTDLPNNNTGLLLRLYLKYLGEPLAWNLERSELRGFVEAQGYRLLDDAEDADLARRYFPAGVSGVLHQGEFEALTEAL